MSTPTAQVEDQFTEVIIQEIEAILYGRAIGGRSGWQVVLGSSDLDRSTLGLDPGALGWGEDEIAEPSCVHRGGDDVTAGRAG
jgi:hypothetical protein